MTMIKIHNKSSKPDNIVLKEHQTIEKILGIEASLPSFMADYFLYLKGAVSLATRHAYLIDIRFFFTYLLEESPLTKARTLKEISLEEIDGISARDVNYFIGDYCARYYRAHGDQLTVYENHNRALSRKKSSLTSLFRFLYRNEMIHKNIVEGFNPIKLPKPQPEAIKRLYVEEMYRLVEVVSRGIGLSETELKYWEKTKKRDKAILLLFITYGLRLKELQELNLSSFNFKRREFTIYRKRGKESTMPLNESISKVIKEYLDLERPRDALEEDALFLSLQKKRMTERSIRILVKKYTAIAMDQPRKDGYSPHKLRATAASTLIEFGFSIYDVQNLLDHENVTTTQLYAAHKKNAKQDIIAHFELDRQEED